MSLPTAKLTSLSRELPQLEARIGGLVLHVRFLSSVIGSIEERLLLQTVQQLRVDSALLHERLREVTGEIETLKRGGPRDPNSQGRLVNARALSARLQRGLTELDHELRQLLAKAEGRINAPGRYGDAALVSGPVFQLLSLLQNILELTTKALQRRAG